MSEGNVKVNVKPISDNYFKILINIDKKMVQYRSFVVDEEQFKNKSNWSSKIEDNRLKIIYNDEELTAFSDIHFKDGKIVLSNEIDKRSYIYGFGEKVLWLNRRFKRLYSWNIDQFIQVPLADPMYKSVPFYLVVNSKKPFGIYVDHPGHVVFDVDVEERNKVKMYIRSSHATIYVIRGKDVKQLVSAFIRLTGKPFMPPKWAIGYHQSRYSYETYEEVNSVASKFREIGIPCDAIYLDIDYMDGYKVFTWDKDRFPDPDMMIKNLHDKGFKIVTIIDVGIKVEKGYFVFEEGLKIDAFIKEPEDKEYFKGTVWPGVCVFPDFLRSKVREWWATLHKGLFEIGVDGIWNDMNEPAIFLMANKVRDFAKHLCENIESLEKVKRGFTITTAGLSPPIVKSLDGFVPIDAIHVDDRGEKVLHNDIHNVYPLLQAKASVKAFRNYKPNKRWFILSRSGFAGIQSYAAVWTGDNVSDWLHLKISIPQLLSLSICGLVFCGADVGGFADNVEPELLVRWMQVGAFYPLFRNHSSKGTVRQEPWAFGEPYTSYIKEAIKLRYRFVPYLYRLFYQAYAYCLPIIRPLFLEFPDDEESYSINDEMMVGESLLVAPITTPGSKARAVYLPKVRWLCLNDGSFLGPGWVMASAGIKDIPLYLREDSAIVTTEDEVCSLSKDVIKNITVQAFVNKEAKMLIYDDDGETMGFEKGEYYLAELRIEVKDGIVNLKFDVKNEFYKPSWEKIKLKIFSERSLDKIYLNSREISFRKVGSKLETEFEAYNL